MEIVKAHHQKYDLKKPEGMLRGKKVSFSKLKIKVLQQNVPMYV